MSTATTNNQFDILKREFGSVRRLQTRNAYANIRLGALRLGMPMKPYGSVQSNTYRATCTEHECTEHAAIYIRSNMF